uniref:Uncharacterized protein n=1 Tax=Sphaerodactylus townsendi TaxID=933632 RepID=A0ACB8E699_9SAUR
MKHRGSQQKPLIFSKAVTQNSEVQHRRARTTLQPACTKDEVAAQVRVLVPHLSLAQEAEYLKASWGMVGRLDLEWVRVGGLFLLHSLLGQAYGIMEAEKEMFHSNCYHLAVDVDFQ